MLIRDVGRFLSGLLKANLATALGNIDSEAKDAIDPAVISHWVTGSCHESSLSSRRVTDLFSRLSFRRKLDGIGVQGGADSDVEGRMDKRKEDEGTTPIEKQLRIGGDIPLCGRTVLQVRFPEIKQYLRSNLSFFFFTLKKSAESENLV